MKRLFRRWLRDPAFVCAVDGCIVDAAIIRRLHLRFYRLTMSRDIGLCSVHAEAVRKIDIGDFYFIPELGKGA